MPLKLELELEFDQGVTVIYSKKTNKQQKKTLLLVILPTEAQSVIFLPVQSCSPPNPYSSSCPCQPCLVTSLRASAAVPLLTVSSLGSLCTSLSVILQSFHRLQAW